MAVVRVGDLAVEVWSAPASLALGAAFRYGAHVARPTAPNRVEAGRPFAGLERLARGAAGSWLVFAWAVAEAIIFPVVRDVLLCLLVLVAPDRALRLFAAAVAGSLLGSAAVSRTAVSSRVMKARASSPGRATSGAPKQTTARERCGTRVPLGRAAAVPRIRTGSTWRCDRTARRPAPGRNGPRSPVWLRVPSGKMSTLQPAARRRSAVAKDLAPPRPERLKAKAPSHAAKNQRRRLAAK